MKHFLQHLKNKGYTIDQGIAMLYLYRIQEYCQRQTEILLAGTE